MLLTMPLSNHLRASKQFLLSPFSWIRSQIQERFRLMELAEQVRDERIALSELSNSGLRDIGIHRAEADLEAGRGYWDLPVVRINNRHK